MNLKKVERSDTFSFTMYTEYDIIDLTIKGESTMNFEPTEKSVKYFRLVTRAMMKASKREEEYLDIEPYFEEAMKSLPEERREMFYLNFASRLHDIGIAKELNM